VALHRSRIGRLKHSDSRQTEQRETARHRAARTERKRDAEQPDKPRG
jgi:hypothetical protein